MVLQMRNPDHHRAIVSVNQQYGLLGDARFLVVNCVTALHSVYGLVQLPHRESSVGERLLTADCGFREQGD